MFMCQRNSFLTEYETEVVTCDPVPFTDYGRLDINPKDIGESTLFKIWLQDTILFPEGGGQPDDRGWIISKNEPSVGEVLRVIRKGGIAEHYVIPGNIDASNHDAIRAKSDGTPTGNSCLPIRQESLSWKKGDKVITKVDWDRRFDHMQQHSGQHLITAVADQLFGYQTTSWWLGTDESNIELDTKELPLENIQKIQDEVNKRIREAIPVSVNVVDLDDPKLQTARGRNLPEDVTGNIRIVTMAGIESNVCCGTHVSNLSQIQVVQLLHVVKKKGKCLLHFLAGERVSQRFSKMFLTEQKLTESLKTNAADLPSAADKLNLALRNSRKSAQVLSKDLASFVAKEFKNDSSNNEASLWTYHRDNAELDFGLAFLREIGDPGSRIVMMTLKGTEGNSGYLLLAANTERTIPKEKLQEIGEKICAVLDGKGSLQKGNNLFQAKVSKLNVIIKAQKLAKELCQDISAVP